MILITTAGPSYLKSDKTMFCYDDVYISSIEYIDNGYDDIIHKQILDEEVFYNHKGQLHNPIGPACVYYTENGTLERYYIHGKKYTQKQFEEITNNKK